jgi:Ca2+-binding RTX toxin-like protein
VTVTGTGGNDQIPGRGSGASATVLGLAAQRFHQRRGSGRYDVLTVSGGDGNDTINRQCRAAGSIGLVLDGGAGNDTITGGRQRAAV